MNFNSNCVLPENPFPNVYSIANANDYKCSGRSFIQRLLRVALLFVRSHVRICTVQPQQNEDDGKKERKQNNTE